MELDFLVSYLVSSSWYPKGGWGQKSFSCYDCLEGPSYQRKRGNWDCSSRVGGGMEMQLRLRELTDVYDMDSPCNTRETHRKRSSVKKVETSFLSLIIFMNRISSCNQGETGPVWGPQHFHSSLYRLWCLIMATLSQSSTCIGAVCSWVWSDWNKGSYSLSYCYHLFVVP